MDYRIESQPSFSVLEVDLAPGEQIVTEAGAMAWMSDNLTVATTARGGLIGGLKRSLLSAESFFQNTYEAEGGPGVIGIAPGQAGNIIAHELPDGELFLEKNAYLASTTDIQTDTSFEGLRGLFNEGLFVLTVSGTGTVCFSGYGDVEEVEVEGSIIVDNVARGGLGAQPRIRDNALSPNSLVPIRRPSPDALSRPGQAVGTVAEPAVAGQLGLPVPSGAAEQGVRAGPALAFRRAQCRLSVLTPWRERRREARGLVLGRAPPAPPSHQFFLAPTLLVRWAHQAQRAGL